MRLTAVWLMPAAWARERVDQWVASLGASSRVFTITRSTSASVMLRGLPGRGSSWRPSSPCSEKRRRHLPTVLRSQPSSVAISLFAFPSAAARTMRQRSARAWALFGRRAQRASVSRSSSLSVTSTRAPLIATSIFAFEDEVCHPRPPSCELMTQDTRRPAAGRRCAQRPPDPAGATRASRRPGSRPRSSGPGAPRRSAG